MAEVTRPAIFKSTLVEVLCIITLAGSAGLSAMSQGSLQLALPTIGRHFHIDGGKLTWIMASGTLTTGSFLLLLATLCDLLGRKKILVFSYMWVAIWALGAGLAPNDVAFDVFRGLSGLGSAGAIPAAVGIVGSIYKQGIRKNKAFACLSGANPAGYVVGLVVGGIATDFIGWRANLFFSAIMYALFAVLAFYFVPSDAILQQYLRDRDTPSSTSSSTTVISDTKATQSPVLSSTIDVEIKPTILSQLRHVDFIGAALITVGFGMFLFALTQAEDANHGWGTSYIIATLVVGLFLIGCFMFWERYMGEKALIPWVVWKYPNFAIIMLIVVLSSINFGGVHLFYSSLWFQEINKITPLLATAYYLPMAIFGILVNVFAAFTLHIISNRILLSVGLLAFTASAMFFAIQPVHAVYWAYSFPSLVLSVVGADLTYMVANLFLMHSVPLRLQSTAGGIFNTLNMLGGTLGLGAGAAIVDGIAGKGPRAGESQAGYLARSYHGAFWFAMATAGLGFVLSLFVKVGTQGAKHKEGQTFTEGGASGHNTRGSIDIEAAETTEVMAGAPPVGAVIEKESSAV